ncbi:MAG TPA: HisA/HisF-related TIM barrel protein [Patescibacteria group bacterium]|nr:HisA/HisF-related TIM barrel protein [Patescibacteria group bacterium]
MLIPCIDLQDGRVVQLKHGRRRMLAIDDVFGVAEQFRSYPVMHVIDLDAAMRRGSNARLVSALCEWSRRSGGPRIRAGGGIRTVRRARQLVGYGAEKVIVGTAAFRAGRLNRAFLSRLRSAAGRRRVLIALDSERGRIVVRGWRQKLALRPEEAIGALEPYCSGFLCTFVDAEGTLRGTDLAWFKSLRRLTKLPITAAGGIRSAGEVRALGQLGMDAAVGMAVYQGILR